MTTASAQPEPAARRTIVRVGGALFSPEGKLLLLSRAGADGSPAQEWELPGGKLDFGEAPEAGLLRCYLESTGLDIAPDRPLHPWSELIGVDAAARHIIHLDYTVRLTGALTGVEIERETHRSFAWLTQPDALARVENLGLRASLERAFAMLARTRGPAPKPPRHANS